MNFDDLKSLLFARSNFGVKLGLPRMRAALELLGDPHLCAPVLHVAGTNGKGSTCAFAAAALSAAGLRAGLYTSPHLLHYCERIRVDGEPIAPAHAAALLEEILARIPWALEGGPDGKGDGDGLTFFELTTLIGFLAFARAKVDAMVVEVGLGGRLDATNVVAPLACAIAALGLEHQQYLGGTLAEIAAEKAGILKAGVPAVTAAQAPEALRVLEEIAARTGAPIFRSGLEYRFEGGEGDAPFRYRGPRWVVAPSGPLALAGRHQRGNAALACALLEAAAARGLPVGPEHAGRGLVAARWPGRLEIAGERPLLLLDGAHNPHASQALASALPELLRHRPLQLVFGCLEDKDASAMLRALLPLCRGVHFCAPSTPRAAAPGALAGIARSLAGRESRAHGTVAEALQAARRSAGEEGAVLCCGSLYLVGEVQALLAGTVQAPMPAEKL